jgi:hypothetical protein
MQFAQGFLFGGKHKFIPVGEHQTGGITKKTSAWSEGEGMTKRPANFFPAALRYFQLR